jgi:hypothetical protein
MKIIYNLVAAVAMAGHVQWTGWGAVLVALGFFLIVWTNYRKSKT